MSAKVFGIGLAKTGTTSLYAAFCELGLRAATYRHFESLGLAPWLDGDLDHDAFAEIDAATDLPLPCFYRHLDDRYPGSKFILTVRDTGPWLESAERHFSRKPKSEFGRRVRIATFGTDGFDAEAFRDVYARHEQDVRSYFEGRDDLLVMDIAGGEGWEKLAPFLGLKAPGSDFPSVQPGYEPPGA